MKCFKKINSLFAAVLCVFVISACGSSSSDSTISSGDTPSSISGVVIDGYLEDARVFLDCNRNFEYDYGEQVTTTGSNGDYIFYDVDNDSAECPVVALGIANQTYEHFDNGSSSEMLHDNLTMISLDNDTSRVISPFTSLHWYYMNNDNMTFEQARQKVKNQLQFPSESAVFEDFIVKARNNSSYRNMVKTSLRMGEYMGYYCGQDNSTDNMTVKMRNAFRYMHQNVGMDNFTESNIQPGNMAERFPVSMGNMSQ